MTNLFKNILFITIGFYTTSCGWLNENPDSANSTVSANDNNKAISEEKNTENVIPEESNEQSAEKKTPSEPQVSTKQQGTAPKTKIDSHYGILIEELGLQIKKLRAELDFLNEELYLLKAQSQVWENPFSIYNKEIVLDNGTTIYGKIIYQDQDIIKVETLIGGLTIDRTTIVKVTENVVEILPKDSLDEEPLKNFIKEGAIIETQQNVNAGKIERTKTTQRGNLIILGSIYEKTDENGNTILSGEIKNIGKQRADFAKINFLFRMNWRGDTKPLTCFAKGSIQDLGNGVVSDASIEPESIGSFELFIPKSFGDFISYSYALDWEEYE